MTGKLCCPGWGEAMCLRSIPAPVLPTSGTKASQSCTMPCAHTGTRLLRLFCKHWLKHTEGRFLPQSGLHSTVCGQCFPNKAGPILMPLLRLGSHPNINPNTTKQGQSLTTNFSQHSHRFLKHSSGVGVKVWGRIS